MKLSIKKVTKERNKFEEYNESFNVLLSELDSCFDGGNKDYFEIRSRIENQTRSLIKKNYELSLMNMTFEEVIERVSKTFIGKIVLDRVIKKVEREG